MTQFDEVTKRRIRFLTRRGLLELDILLSKFMEKEFQTLSDDELAVFVEVLDLPDQDFLGLVNQTQPCLREDFETLLDKIRQAK